ncbi:RNI-like protein [Rhizoclosmatium globosum]|uniref:RNI-like protein n=1 Tax=Rhizoclosmatium globosum TaxID=329046 RepID=A0A1Y2BUG6_9FUNG|nr:RNI-like protein [Rhizoclosmatium globosum]|eukprot:ORY38412.1 RNI-like protein [Rhizoclosmatium globosum]
MLMSIWKTQLQRQPDSPIEKEDEYQLGTNGVGFLNHRPSFSSISEVKMDEDLRRSIDGIDVIDGCVDGEATEKETEKETETDKERGSGGSIEEGVRVGVAVVVASRTRASASARLPSELLSHIAHFVDSNKDRRELGLVNSWWAEAVAPLLWNHVSLVSPVDVLRFLRSTIHTVARHNNPSILKHLPQIEESQLIQISNLPKVDLAAINNTALPALVNALNGNLEHIQQHIEQHTQQLHMLQLQHLQQLQQQLQEQQQQQGDGQGPNDGPNNIPMDIENPIANLTTFMNSLVQMALIPPSDTSSTPPLAPVIAAKPSNDMEIDSFKSFGFADHVKKLSIPSFDCQVNLLFLLNDLLPNLQSIHFQHIHTDETTGGNRHTAIFTPVSTSILTAFAPIIQRVTRVSIEDVYPTSWPQILNLLSGTNPETPNVKTALPHLRSLNLEAVATTDSFDSPTKLSTVFPSLPNLEACRLDGIALGPDSSILSLTRWCPNLKVIALDYCPSVTMKSFEVLWNNLTGLSFLGLAGIVNDHALHNHHHHPSTSASSNQHDRSQKVKLKPHDAVRIVRLVDCDVSDGLFEGIREAGTDLEMLRFVFEDDECEGILSVVQRLSDHALRSFGEDVEGGGRRKGLKKLAFTWCPGFTAACLKNVLEYGSGVEVLDLHKDVGCSLGEMPGSVLEEVGESLRRVKVLNLYGQTKLTDETLRRVFTPHNCPSLTSLCINDSQVTPATLRHIVCSIPTLTALSIIQCPNIELDDLKRLFAECPVEMRRIKRLYTEHCWKSVAAPRDENVDSGGPAHPDAEVLNMGSDDEFHSAFDLSDEVRMEEHDGDEDEDMYGTPLIVSSVMNTAGQGAPNNHNSGGITASTEPRSVIHDDLWFCHESLDILSLFNGSVKRATDIRV